MANIIEFEIVYSDPTHLDEEVLEFGTDLEAARKQFKEIVTGYSKTKFSDEDYVYAILNCKSVNAEDPSDYEPEVLAEWYFEDGEVDNSNAKPTKKEIMEIIESLAEEE